VNHPKILFVAANEGSRWGGSEFLWSSAADKLVRRGCEVRVSVKHWDAPVRQVEALREAGCRIFYRRPPTFFSRLGRKVLPLPAYDRSHFHRAARGMDLVVISQGGNIEGLPWMEFSRETGSKYAVIAQCASETWAPDDAAAERLAAGYEGAIRPYFVSEANLDLTRRQFTVSLARAQVIRNPFNVRYDARPPWPSDESDRLSLACVARLEVSAKGQDLLLEVLNLPHWRERNVRLSLVGGGINERMLRRRADHLKLTTVEFQGYSNDIEGIWARHHALVLPSRCEGLPLAIVEAMLCSRPCIVTDVAGNSEMVRDGANGFLAAAPTINLLDAALNRAWDARSRLRAMGETAAIDVRRTVPKDPGEDFAQELLRLAGKSAA
jgi:glycosyltransferase involved in cell wall biosynthesis